MYFANVFLFIILSLIFSELPHLLFSDFSSIASSADNLPPWELSSLMNSSLHYLLICPEPEIWFWVYPWKTTYNSTSSSSGPVLGKKSHYQFAFCTHSFITLRALSPAWHSLTCIFRLFLVFNLISDHKDFFSSSTSFFFFPPKFALSCSLTVNPLGQAPARGSGTTSWGAMPDVHCWRNFQLFGIAMLSYGSYPSLRGPLVLSLPVKSILLSTLVLSLVLPYNAILKLKCNQTGLAIPMSLQSSNTLGKSAILHSHPCCILQTDMIHGANQNIKPNKADVPWLSIQPAGSVPRQQRRGWVQVSKRAEMCALLPCSGKRRTGLFWLSLKVTDISW